jgi:hypothetical protein
MESSKACYGKGGRCNYLTVCLSRCVWHRRPRQIPVPTSPSLSIHEFPEEDPFPSTHRNDSFCISLKPHRISRTGKMGMMICHMGSRWTRVSGAAFWQHVACLSPGSTRQPSSPSPPPGSLSSTSKSRLAKPGVSEANPPVLEQCHINSSWFREAPAYIILAPLCDHALSEGLLSLPLYAPPMCPLEHHQHLPEHHAALGTMRHTWCRDGFRCTGWTFVCT